MEGATASFDGADPAPIPAAFEVAPGEHRFIVEAPQHVSKTLSTVAVEGTVTALNVELEPSPGQVEVTAPEGARVHLDGRDVGTSPLPGPLPVAPGVHVFAVTERGRTPFVRSLRVRRGAPARIDAELPRSNQRIAAWAVLGTSAGLLASAGTTLALTLDKEAQARALEARHVSEGLSVSQAQRYRELERDRNGLADATIGLGVAAGLVGVAGALLFVFDEPDLPDLPGDSQILLMLGPGTVGASAGGSF